MRHIHRALWVGLTGLQTIGSLAATCRNTWTPACLSGRDGVIGWQQRLAARPSRLTKRLPTVRSWEALCRPAVVAALVLAALAWPAQVAMAQALVLSRTIELPDVRGRLDHMDITPGGGHLFLAAHAAGSVEIVDLKAGARSGRIENLRKPQGVIYAADSKHLFVATGGGASVEIFADSKRLAGVGGLDDADNMRIDPATGLLYIGYGSALAIVDPKAMKVVGRVALEGHPEAFELAAGGQQIYVNVPDAQQIAVVDRRSGKVSATWPIAGARQNFAMALDDARHRLFIATRQPAMLHVYDTDTGKRTAALGICGDTDDLFFDGERRQLYVVCGEGAVEVVRQRDGDRYDNYERVQTAPGARTGLFVPRLATLFVAVPSRGNSPAEIRAYRVK